MIRNPLNQPIAAPTSSASGITSAPGSPSPKPPAAAGTTSMTAIAGAVPTVDSSDRSNLPAIRIIASASTSSEIAACCWSTLVRLPAVRKIGSAIAPTMSRSTITGTRVRSRKRARRSFGAGAVIVVTLRCLP